MVHMRPMCTFAFVRRVLTGDLLRLSVCLMSGMCHAVLMAFVLCLSHAVFVALI